MTRASEPTRVDSMASSPPLGAIVFNGGGAPRLPLVLCWHKVEPRHELGVGRIGPRRFARQIARLARDGWRTVTLHELLATAAGRRAAGPRELLVTFDDAYRGLREHAFPVLRDHGFGALCFVVTDYAGRLNRWDVAYGGRRFAHLAWRDMERWREQGIAFGSHTATHPRLTWLADAEVMRELERSRSALHDALGDDDLAVSYPFGAARARERALAGRAGYVAGFGLAAPWRGDVMALARLPVYCWSPPAPGTGALAPLEWRVARAANRCAVGTTLIQRLGRRLTRSTSRSPASASGA